MVEILSSNSNREVQGLEHHGEELSGNLRNSPDSPAQQARNTSYWKSTDFLELIGCLIFGVLCTLPTLLAEPRNRPIPFQKINSGELILNQNHAYEFDSETIPALQLGGFAVLLPLGIQLLLSHVVSRTRRREFHRTLCTYGVAVGLTLLTTESIKRYVGYLRPSFYDLCEPNEDMTACTAEGSSDARQSFPSGHASVAFCGMYLFSMYLEERVIGLSSVTEVVTSRKVGILDEEEGGNSNGESVMVVRYKTKTPQLYRLFSLLCLLPVAVAIYVASSRIVDNKHFPADVVGGALVGVACARFTHRLWFPSSIALLTGQ